MFAFDWPLRQRDQTVCHDQGMQLRVRVQRVGAFVKLAQLLCNLLVTEDAVGNAVHLMLDKLHTRKTTI